MCIRDSYITNSVKNLHTLPAAVGVGGRITPKGFSSTGRAIAKALRSSWGNGGASYRQAQSLSKTDTIWCGCWRRSDAISVGLFNESREANEDFEFNQRLRKIGDIYTCPDITARQYVREKFSLLYRQYFRYGFWKATVVKDHPRNFKLRQAIPLTFFTALILSLLFTLVSRCPFLILTISYFTLILIAPFKLKPTSISESLRISLAIGIIHLAWLIGFVTGICTNINETEDNNGE